ncbi:MAG: hypothetical protein AB9Q22_13320 [Candidatus Reddybacter sp.]
MRIKINNKYCIKSMLLRIINLALIIVCALPINTLFAEENKTETEQKSKTSQSSELDNQVSNPEQKQPSPQQTTKKPKRTSRFKPSETISEDYSVPFPIDI